MESLLAASQATSLLSSSVFLVARSKKRGPYSQHCHRPTGYKIACGNSRLISPRFSLLGTFCQEGRAKRPKPLVPSGEEWRKEKQLISQASKSPQIVTTSWQPKNRLKLRFYSNLFIFSNGWPPRLVKMLDRSDSCGEWNFPLTENFAKDVSSYHKRQLDGFDGKNKMTTHPNMLSDRPSFAGKNCTFSLYSYEFVRSPHGRDILLDPKRLRSRKIQS